MRKNHSKIVCIKLVHLPYLYIWCTVTLISNSTWFYNFPNNPCLIKNHSMLCSPRSVLYCKVSKGLPRQAEVDQGVPGRLRPRIILTFRHYKGGRSSVIRTGHLYPRRNPRYSFSGAELTPGYMVLSEGTREKIPSGTTGNRSRDRPTSSTVP